MSYRYIDSSCKSMSPFIFTTSSGNGFTQGNCPLTTVLNSRCLESHSSQPIRKEPQSAGVVFNKIEGGRFPCLKLTPCQVKTVQGPHAFCVMEPVQKSSSGQDKGTVLPHVGNRKPACHVPLPAAYMTKISSEGVNVFLLTIPCGWS